MNIGVEYIKRGIRLMVDECKDAGLEAPVFMSSEYQVTAIFQRNDYSEDKSKLSNNLSVKDTANYGTTEDDKINDKINDLHLTDSQRKVYEYLNQKSKSNDGNMIKLTISVIKTETGLSYPTVQRILKDFENMNIVRHIGAKKRGSWILIDKQ